CGRRRRPSPSPPLPLGAGGGLVRFRPAEDHRFGKGRQLSSSWASLRRDDAFIKEVKTKSFLQLAKERRFSPGRYGRVGGPGARLGRGEGGGKRFLVCYAEREAAGARRRLLWQRKGL